MIDREEDRKPISINIDAEGRTIAKALKSMIAKANAAGIKRPTIYFESAGGVHVLDRDVLDRMGDRVEFGGSRVAVVGSVQVGDFDVGAW